MALMVLFGMVCSCSDNVALCVQQGLLAGAGCATLNVLVDVGVGFGTGAEAASVFLVTVVNFPQIADAANVPVILGVMS
jgi:hypothetical protein